MIEDVLEAVGLRPEETLGRYPHQLSGGQRQRIMVARALLLKPRLIVADEPVSMVDASLRATILELAAQLNEEFGISILYITHDLTTAYQISDNIVVLYRGSVAEAGRRRAGGQSSRSTRTRNSSFPPSLWSAPSAPGRPTASRAPREPRASPRRGARLPTVARPSTAPCRADGAPTLSDRSPPRGVLLSVSGCSPARRGRDAHGVRGARQARENGPIRHPDRFGPHLVRRVRT